MFLSDNAIKDEKGDELNRAEFAKRFAEEILNWSDEESIVLAMYGDWGKGKTSILNIAISHIEYKTKKWVKSKQPIIVKFNPWNFSEQNDLLLSFLENLFSAVSNRISPTKKNFQKEVNELAKALGALRKIPIIGMPLEATSDVLNWVVPEETLEDLRGKIDKYFRGLDCKVIIVIDDIDRLTQKEIRQIFQLIKVTANFPNTVYLTAFDQIIVEKALDIEQGISGHNYLEKIIQVGFDIPAIEPGRIEKFLLPKLDSILNSLEVENWDQTRWGNLYFGGLKKLFTSLRDAKRFLNGLAFNISIVKGEVNLVDFIGIEALRVFLPEIYKAIVNNKELFLSTYISDNQEERAKNRKLLDEIFALVKDRSEIAKNICLELFPKLNTYYPRFFMGTWTGNPEVWRRERRVCSEDIFDTYFVMGVPMGEVSQAELQHILSLAPQPNELIVLFRKYLKQDRILRLLDWLRDIIGDLSEEGVWGLCHALIAIGDELAETRKGNSVTGDDFQLHSLLFRALSRIQDKNQRFEWFLERINQSDALHTLVKQVVWNIPSKDERIGVLFDEEQLKALIEACVSKIAVFAYDGRLLSIGSFISLLKFWKDWANEKDIPQKFIEGLVATPNKAITFAESFVYEGVSHTFGDHVSRKHIGFDFETLKKLIDLEKLKNTLSSLTEKDKENLSEKQRFAIKMILKGRSDDFEFAD